MIARILYWVAARLMPKPDVHVLDEREFVIPDIPLRFYRHSGHEHPLAKGLREGRQHMRTMTHYDIETGLAEEIEIKK